MVYLGRPANPIRHAKRFGASPILRKQYTKTSMISFSR